MVTKLSREIASLAEEFRDLRDQQLGRYRDPIHTTLVVYPTWQEGQVRVVDETTGVSVTLHQQVLDHLECPNRPDPFVQAAKRYYQYTTPISGRTT